jgi:hypothetical protein
MCSFLRLVRWLDQQYAAVGANSLPAEFRAAAAFVPMER